MTDELTTGSERGVLLVTFPGGGEDDDDGDDDDDDADDDDDGVVLLCIVVPAAAVDAAKVAKDLTRCLYCRLA